MNEEPLQTPGKEPVEDDLGQTTEKTSEAEDTSRRQNETESPKSDPVDETPGEEKEETTEQEQEKAASGEPPVDWFEPLEDDDDDDASTCINDLEDESLAGETESIGGGDNAFKKVHQ